MLPIRAITAHMAENDHEKAARSCSKGSFVLETTEPFGVEQFESNLFMHV